MKFFKETLIGKTILATIGTIIVAFAIGVLSATIAVAFKFGWQLIW